RDGRRGKTGLAERVPPLELVAATGLDDHDVAVFGREVHPPVRGDGGSAEGVALCQLFLIDWLARPRLVAGKHTAGRADGEIIPINDRCRRIGAAFGVAPGDERADPTPARQTRQL